MTSTPVPGTQGYAGEAETLIARYEAISFAELHADVQHLFPLPPASVLEIGAGTGRDAAAFARLGHRVVAAEPTRALRHAGMTLHHSPMIEWLDDSLPWLSQLTKRGKRFDLVMLTAVWMHLDADERAAAMPRVAALVEQNGFLVVLLRHGPVPSGRRMFEVSAAETIALAMANGLSVALHLRDCRDMQKRTDVTWTRLAFQRHEG